MTCESPGCWEPEIEDGFCEEHLPPDAYDLYERNRDH